MFSIGGLLDYSDEVSSRFMISLLQDVLSVPTVPLGCGGENFVCPFSSAQRACGDLWGDFDGACGRERGQFDAKCLFPFCQ